MIDIGSIKYRVDASPGTEGKEIPCGRGGLGPDALFGSRSRSSTPTPTTTTTTKERPRTILILTVVVVEVVVASHSNKIGTLGVSCGTNFGIGQILTVQ